MNKAKIKKYLSSYKNDTVKIKYDAHIPACPHDRYDATFNIENPDFIIIDENKEEYIPLCYDNIDYIFHQNNVITIICKRGIIICLHPYCETALYIPPVYEFNSTLLYEYSRKTLWKSYFFQLPNPVFYEEIIQSYIDCFYTKEMDFYLDSFPEGIHIFKKTIPYESISGYVYCNDYLYLIIGNDLFGLPLKERYNSMYIVNSLTHQNRKLPVETIEEAQRKIKRMNRVSVQSAFSRFKNTNFIFMFSENELKILNKKMRIVKKKKYKEIATIDKIENIYCCYLPDTDSILSIHSSKDEIDETPA